MSAKTTKAPSSPSTGADAGVELMYFVGMRFWICGVPGIMVIVMDAAPKTNDSMKRCQGMSASCQRCRAMGRTVKMTTKRLTPP